MIATLFDKTEFELMEEEELQRELELESLESIPYEGVNIELLLWDKEQDQRREEIDVIRKYVGYSYEEEE